MSFSSQVKEELAALVPESSCCAAAETYGLVEYGHAFSSSAISLQTENAAVASSYHSFISVVCGLSEDAVSQSVRPSGIHIVNISSEAGRRRVLERFGHSFADITSRFNRANIECESCPAAYLRGAFLSCGTVTDPNTGYHMEFSVPYYTLSRDLLTFMKELGFNARLVRRKGSYIIYIKESEQIEDCLTLMGATKASLEMMSVNVVKNIRNTANRITNCENANIDKTVAASMDQIAAIRRIEERKGLESLPEELRELARLRLDNPDMSLRELGEQLTPPLSRSGINHRLKRIMEYAEGL